MDRILIVDGDAKSRDTMAEWLRAAGYEALKSGSGGEALMSSAATPPDLILVDRALPEMRRRLASAREGEAPVRELSAAV